MRYKLIIEYDGTNFKGWQRQKSGLAIQEVIENALKTALREEITLFGSGRTDTGVHAIGQVAHFETEQNLNLFKIRESLNALVRPHLISIHDVQKVSDDFHARFSAKERSYVYQILNSSFPPALLKNKVWWIHTPLDINSMQEAANLLIGKHDFSTFRASECQAKSPIKTINSIHFEQDGNIIKMHISAKSFLHHQVRNIIGSLVLVGQGKWSIKDFEIAFKGKDRKLGGPTAPPEGLYFVSVKY